MPELPEVERAASLLRSVTQERRFVRHVEAQKDEIVFTGITHEEFCSEITGRNVLNVGRYGKLFYLELDNDQRHPVLHFGMTGMLQIKGEKAVHYREAPRKTSADWPPRFMKFIITLAIGPAADPSSDIHVAFLDARRLGRIRLCTSPLKEHPISELGFDPILCMPNLEDFKPLVLRRKCPIKALLLDQTFSAGVGNWVADEVLYHARIHPESRCNGLSEDELGALHHWIQEVCTVAVKLNADDKKFPDNWLFRHRWNKGKKAKKSEQDEEGLKLPSGEPATIKWTTVGGRTSAYVVELQKLSGEDRGAVLSGSKSGTDEFDDSDLTPLSDEEVVMTTPQQKRKPAAKTKLEKQPPLRKPRKVKASS